MRRGIPALLPVVIAGVAAAAGAQRLFGWAPDPLDDLYDRRKPLVFGHRGVAIAPENTLPGFEAAIRQGADGIELDVQLTADAVPVVIHDFTLDKTTSGSGPVRAHTLAQIRQLDAGSWFGAQFAGTRVPTLAEVLDLARGRLLVNIELKSWSLRSAGLEAAVVEVVRRCGMERQVIVSSFNPLALGRMRRLAPRIPTALLYAGNQPVPLRHRWLTPLVRPDALHPGRSLASERHIWALQARGHRVNVWTVNDVGELDRLIAAGVDGLITDYPERAVRRRELAFAVRPGAPSPATEGDPA